MQFPAVLNDTFHRITYKKSVLAEFIQAQDFVNLGDGVSHRFHQLVEIHAGRHRTHRSVLRSAIKIIVFRSAWRGIKHKNLNLSGTKARGKIEPFLAGPNVRLIDPRPASFANWHAFFALCPAVTRPPLAARESYAHHVSASCARSDLLNRPFALRVYEPI